MPQTVSVDLDMGWDNTVPAASEKLTDALNYKAVSKRVTEFVQEKKYELVETAADGIADMVMSEFAVPWIRVAIHKPFAVTGSSSVGVVVERGDDHA